MKEAVVLAGVEALVAVVVVVAVVVFVVHVVVVERKDGVVKEVLVTKQIRENYLIRVGSLCIKKNHQIKSHIL